MTIERLRSLEKDIRNSGGSGCQYHADQLASIIAELGQEVGAVAPVAYRKMVNTIGGPYWEFSTVFNAEHAISTGPTGYEPLYPSPAQTSDARDAARWRFVTDGLMVDGVPHVCVHRINSRDKWITEWLSADKAAKLVDAAMESSK